jgi:outer membrane protein OmpU
MNKLTKLGVSALCGSLAAVSAQAGELTVKGGATATYTSLEGQTTGNPIGLSSGMTFTGSGELDNGSTFALTLTHTDQSAYSAGNIAITTPSMGKFTIQQSGGGIDRYDDMMPTAWEETNGTGLATGLDTVAGVGAAGNIEWTAPADMLGDGISLQVAYSPTATGGNINDKGVGGDSGKTGSGWDITASHNGLVDGLNVFVGHSTQEQAKENNDSDRTERVIGATYAVGNFTVGYQWSKESLNPTTAASVSYYENDAFGISFAVNDDLSISYGKHKSDKVTNAATSTELDGDSIQLAYSMGGASIKIAETSVSDGKYNTANDQDATTVALTLAF